MRRARSTVPVVGRRELLLDAAIELVGTKGMRALTHRGVDEAASLPQGSTSNLFRTRRALVEGVLDRLIEHDHALIGPTGEPSSTAEQLIELVVSYVQSAVGSDVVRTRARFAVFAEAMVDESLRTAVERRRDQLRPLAADLLRGLHLPNPEATARVALDAIDGMILHQLTGQPVDTVQLSADLAALVGQSRPREGRRSFDRAALVYDGIRHSYPPALFADLFALLPTDPRIIEVGPGTGQATADLLAHGARVEAIELGPQLGATLRRNLPTDRLEVWVDDFETAAIAPGADALFSATAYHWIARAAQTDRPAALLRTGGLLAVVGTVQVNDPVDGGFFAAAQPIYQRHGQGHRGPSAPTRHGVDSELGDRLAADPRYVDVELRCYDWDQHYTTEQYRRLMLSYSTTQLMDEPARSALLDEIAALVDSDFGGRVTRPLVITLTTARLGQALL